jgi:glycosyltransferase involved in cell wall biosynthesis
MRIGIDARLLYYQMGGISQYTLYLLATLGVLDKTTSYVVFQMQKDKRNYAPEQVNFQRVNAMTPCHHKYEKWAFSAETIPQRLDILHSPDFIPPLKGARKHVITVHDLNFLYYPQFLTAESRRYYNDQIEWAVERADAISADSEHTRRDLITRLKVPPEKVRTIYLAANLVYEKPYSAEAIDKTLAKHHLERGFILFVGTLEPRKNIPTLLKAYRCLRDDHGVNVPLVLVGRKGWLSDAIFATIEELNLGAYVHHLQGVFDAELAHLYHAAGVLTLPSHYEGFGLPPLEAMHCGCPVVTSNRGSLPEIVGDAGIMLEADEVEPWAEAIARVLGDESLRAQMIAAGFVQAKTFSWERTGRQTLDMYHEVVGHEVAGLEGANS